MTFADEREQLLYATLRIRRVEEHIARIYPDDCIQSPVHLSLGQEAVAVGTCAPLARTDMVFGTYRSHAFYLAKGGSLREMMAELFGKATGCAGGKAGSMHLTAPEVGFMGSSAVVASTIPNAVGAAFAARRRRTNAIVVGVFGDGATEEGVYHESLNFAALHRLPVLFLCENNEFAVHSPRRARQSYDITEHARSFGIAAKRCGAGFDPEVVRDAVAEAVLALRSGAGPRFIECATYRYAEHVGIGDDHQIGYRPLATCNEWRARDPLLNSRACLERFEAPIAAEIEDAVAFAEASPWPTPDALLRDVA